MTDTITDTIRKQSLRDDAPDRPALRALNDAAYAATRESLRLDPHNRQRTDDLRHIAGVIDRMVDGL